MYVCMYVYIYIDMYVCVYVYVYVCVCIYIYIYIYSNRYVYGFHYHFNIQRFIDSQQLVIVCWKHIFILPFPSANAINATHVTIPALPHQRDAEMQTEALALMMGEQASSDSVFETWLDLCLTPGFAFA